MRETRRPGKYPCQKCCTRLKILHRFQNVLESNIMINGIAIVKSTANKNSCHSFGDSKIHIPSNSTKVTNVIKAAN